MKNGKQQPTNERRRRTHHPRCEHKRDGTHSRPREQRQLCGVLNMAYLQAYCIHCASKAGNDGTQCDRCANLPHVSAHASRLGEDGEAEEFRSHCPKCQHPKLSPSWDGLLMCKGCGSEYVCSDPEDAAAAACPHSQAGAGRVSLDVLPHAHGQGWPEVRKLQDARPQSHNA